MSKRTQQVQVPGQTATPTNDTTSATPAPEAGATVDTPVEPPATAAPETPAAPAADVDPKPAKAAKSKERPDYRSMHADEVDPSTLTASVLTLDGWVVPSVQPKAKD